MANYPSISFTLASDESIKDGIVVDRAMSGAGKGRNLWTGKKRAYTLKHSGLSATDKGTLETFYDANRAASISLTWVDGTTRTVILTGMKISPWPNLSTGRRWDVQVTAEEV